MTDQRRSPEEPFDLDRLDPDERELWDEFFAGPLGNEGPTVRVWGFDYACMLLLSGHDRRSWMSTCGSNDPDNRVPRYFENVLKAKRSR